MYNKFDKVYKKALCAPLKYHMKISLISMIKKKIL